MDMTKSISVAVELLDQLAGMELDTTERSIKIQDELRAILAQPAEAEGVVPVVGYLVDVPDEPELGHWYEEEAEEEGEDLGPPLTRCQPLVRQSDHLAALSAVTAERDRLRAELEMLRDNNRKAAISDAAMAAKEA